MMLHRFWALLFALVPILGIGLYVVAFLGWGGVGGFSFAGLWLPENANPFAAAIDHLFDWVHVLCGIILGVTTSLLAYIVWRFADHPGRNGEPAQYITHNTLLEWIWTAIPAAILVFLGFYQLQVWADNKMNRPVVQVAGKSEVIEPMALVVGKQFGWDIYYPGKDGQLGTMDDVRVENELRVPVGKPIVLRVEARDVLHSFAVPGLRVKQDVVPGMTQLVWFQVDRPGTFEILCMELCGWGHYKMRARLIAEPATGSPMADSKLQPEAGAGVEDTVTTSDSVDDLNRLAQSGDQP
jgi:cytochrome c oxidase subunit 2